MGEENVISEISGTVIRVKTPRGDKTFDISKILSIDLEDLSKEFSSQASLYVFFATLVPWAEKIEAMLDLVKDQEYASADEAFREELTQKGEKYTETVIKNLVTRDEGFVKAFEKHAMAKYDVNLLKAVTRAFEQRADMLVSLGAHQRHEWEMTGLNSKVVSETDLNVEDVKRTILERRHANKNAESQV